MHNKIAEASSPAPVDLWVLLFERLGHVGGGFAHYGKLPQRNVLQVLVGQKFGQRTATQPPEQTLRRVLQVL